MTAAAPCRYASNVNHACVRNDGTPVRPGGVCFYEAVTQLREQQEVDGTAVYVTDPGVYPMLADATLAARRQGLAS